MRYRNYYCRFGSIAWTAALCLLGLTPAARAGDPNTELQSAFEKGRGDGAEDVDPPELQVRRFGRTVLLEATLAQSGELTRLTCALCTRAEALSRARSLGALLTTREAGTKPALVAAPELKPLERVTVDGIPLVPASIPTPIEPGRHRVEIHGEAGAASGKVKVEPGAQVELLSKSEPVTVERIVPLKTAVLVAGLGLTAMAVGGMFLWLHDECADEKCDNRHNLKAGGWSLIGAGALTGGLMVVLTWPRTKEAKGEDR